MQSPSQSQQISAELRDEILRGRFRSGERLPSERDLAERFGVHRGAVREALKKLEQLGLADIQPGGARVSPLEEASLDVVKHLLELDDPPDPVVVDQVLEVFSGFFGMAARFGTERATGEQRERILAHIERLSDPALDPELQFDGFHELGDLFLEASGNIVLKLVRNGLNTHLIERIRRGNLDVPPPASLRMQPLRHMTEAVRAGDGAAAAEAAHEFTVALRGHVTATLAAAPPATPAPASAATHTGGGA